MNIVKQCFRSPKRIGIILEIFEKKKELQILFYNNQQP